ncbi:hypothetical protein MNBD_GAMMA14-746 [hydrothermal vent metagenome]|uniref:Ribbon-helix-helix protein CopG domain-containing protein n=1 Tax=hydrothermal vent metagenome TaxID=652676 RepID=A0A3B0Z027_9ZZZZ
MSTLSLRIPDDLDKQLEEEASRANKSRSELVRDAVADYLARKEKERFLGDFVAEARAGYANAATRQDAQAIADDFLPVENEALDPSAEDKWWK